jgi:hypothetical protein
MNLFAKILLSAALLAAFTGCTPLEELRQNAQAYNAEDSFAKNITHQLSLRLKDQELPKDAPRDLPPSATDRFLKDTAVNVSLHAAAGTFAGFGPLFFFSAGEWLFSRPEPETRNWILFYLPDNGTPMTEKDAAEAQIAELKKSFDRFFEAKKAEYTEVEYSGSLKVPLFDRLLFGYLFANKMCREQIVKSDGRVFISVVVPYTDNNLYRINVPDWINPAKPAAWKNTAMEIEFRYPKGTLHRNKSPNEYLFFQEFAPFLPDNAFIYAAPHKNDDGQNPPMVFDNKKVHFFVKPPKP